MSAQTTGGSSAPSQSAQAAIDLARQVGESMFAVDTELHLNGHKICHGGFIFTLADSTFAFACNSYNKAAVAAGCSIEFLKPGQLGDVLTCVGQEQTMSGRHGIYDMKVTNQKGEVIAMFRGKSAQIQGTVIPE
jgi:acyl-CoA thioesterase